MNTIRLSGYKASPTSLRFGTVDSYGVEDLQLKFDDIWAGLAVTATFTAPNGTSTDKVVGMDGTVEVPHEATCNGAGQGVIVLRGCIDCLFDNLNIQVRSQNEDRPMPCCLILKNCGGLKNVYPSIIAGGTKNYWKLFNQFSFIENDLLTDATETTTYDEMTSIKSSTN